jgi:hypothetical protein
MPTDTPSDRESLALLPPFSESNFLPTAFCLLPTAYCLPTTAYCVLPSEFTRT